MLCANDWPSEESPLGLGDLVVEQLVEVEVVRVAPVGVDADHDVVRGVGADAGVGAGSGDAVVVAAAARCAVRCDWAHLDQSHLRP